MGKESGLVGRNERKGRRETKKKIEKYKKISERQEKFNCKRDENILRKKDR